MAIKIVFTKLFIICLLGFGIRGNAQEIWFGTVKIQDKTLQGRFEVFGDTPITKIIYAPYGITPVYFTEFKHQKNQLTFNWRIDQSVYRCFLLIKDSTEYKGNCSSDGQKSIQLVIRQFSETDAFLQGDSLHASAVDIQILDRALNLLNNGTNWNRADNRVCDNSSYPYRWSLFCALHQASIDITSEYRHLRPANQATRQAINEITSGKKYAHTLQDYNNEADGFNSIKKMFERAKEIINEKMKIKQ